MEADSIYFTKLGTVKFKDVELTTESFFIKMKEQIKLDNERYKVSYNEEDNQYVIRYDDKNYVAKKGDIPISKTKEDKEISSKIDELVSLSKKVKDIKEFDKKELSVDDIIKKGDSGVFDSDEDKKLYIDVLNNRIKELKKYKNKIVYDGLKLQGLACGSLAIDIIGFMAALIVWATGVDGAKIAMAGLMGKLMFDWCMEAFEQHTLLGFIVEGTHRFISWYNYKKNSKKEIGELEKKITYLKGSVGNKDSYKLDINDRQASQKEKEKNENDSNAVILNDLNDLNNKISSLENKEKMENYLLELKGMINNYEEAIKSGKSSNNIELKKNISDHIVSMLYRVDTTLKEEENVRQIKAERNMLESECTKREIGKTR